MVSQNVFEIDYHMLHALFLFDAARDRYLAAAPLSAKQTHRGGPPPGGVEAGVPQAQGSARGAVRAALAPRTVEPNGRCVEAPGIRRRSEPSARAHPTTRRCAVRFCCALCVYISVQEVHFRMRYEW